jgi:hypothetical protein
MGLSLWFQAFGTILPHSASLLAKYSTEVRLLNVLYEYAVSSLTSDPISI